MKAIINLDQEITDPKKLKKIQKLENKIGKQLSTANSDDQYSPDGYEEVDIIFGIFESMGFKSISVVFAQNLGDSEEFTFSADTLTGNIIIQK